MTNDLIAKAAIDRRLAEIITPRSARMDRVISPTAGVGTGPSSNTFMPVEVSPAVNAFSSM